MELFSLYPSLISANLLNLQEVVLSLNPYVQGYHIDIMDGHFVPNITWGPHFIAAFQSLTSLPLHIHCMVSNPERVLHFLPLRSIDTVIVHAESTLDLHQLIESIRDKDVKVGLALNQETPVKKYSQFIGLIDHLLLMSVNPGFSGQSFMPATFEKYTHAKEIIEQNGYSCELGADGGVSVHNITSIVHRGVTNIAAAKAIFSFTSPIEGVLALQNAVLR